MAKIKILLSVLFLTFLIISGCENNATNPTAMSDDEFLQTIVSSGYDNDDDNEENLMVGTYFDLNDGGPIPDNGDGFMTPIDSLYRWGRKITGVNRNYNITNEGDSIKNLTVTTTFTGNYIILGRVNNVTDTIIKPYSEVLKRNLIFKRIARNDDPRKNWRLYSVSGLDGQTTQPQAGNSVLTTTKIEIYVNGSGTPTYTFNGPDFSNLSFITKRFGGSGIPVLDRGDNVKVKVYVTSSGTSPDYVAFHWAKNTFGFHRVPFSLESQNGNDRVYSKTFTIYNSHKKGVFNGYLSASSRESLYDDNASLFASDIMSIPFRVTK